MKRTVKELIEQAKQLFIKQGNQHAVQQTEYDLSMVKALQVGDIQIEASELKAFLIAMHNGANSIKQALLRAVSDDTQLMKQKEEASVAYA